MQRDTVSFSGRTSYEAFVKKFHTTNLTDAIFLKKCMSQEALGQGAEGTVYPIPIKGLEDYVVKVYRKDFVGKFSKSHIGRLASVQDEFPEYNFGQQIAKMGDNISILKRVNGIDLLKYRRSLKENKNYKKLSKIPIIKNIIAHQYLQGYYKKLAQLPQESYDNYAKQIHLANDKGYIFDGASSGNVILNGDKLNIIDLWKAQDKNSMGSIMSPILYGYDFIKSDKILKNFEIVTAKLFCAAKKENFEFNRKKEFDMLLSETASEPVQKIFSKILFNSKKS